MTRFAAVSSLAAIIVALIAADVAAQQPHPAGDIDFDGVIAGARGGGRPKRGRPVPRLQRADARGREDRGAFLTLHKKGDHLYAEIPMHQLNQPMLVPPITIARGIGMTGYPVSRSDEMVLIFRRVGDRIQLVRRNIHYRLQGAAAPAKLVAGQVGQAKLHRLGAARPADPRDQSGARDGGGRRLLRHLLH